MNKTSKIKHFFINNKKPLCLIFSAILINAFIFLIYFKKYQGAVSISPKIIIAAILLVILQIGFFSAIFFVKRKKFPIEKIFIFFAIPIGLLYMLAVPIGRVPDEGAHFARIYEITTGHFVSDTDESGMPGSLEDSNIKTIINMPSTIHYGELPSYTSIYADTNSEEFVYTSSYNYNIINYFPQVIGMSLGNFLHLPLLISCYIARFFNLLTCLLIIYFSIKYIPFLKKGIMFIAFLPITMQEICSLSADGLPIATSIALISFILYSIYSLKNQFTKKHLAIMLLLCIVICLCKTIYAPICLLLFTIPKARFGSIKRKLHIIFGFGIISGALLLGWLYISPPLVSVSDSSIQTASIIEHPIRYLGILINSIFANSGIYLSGIFGGFLEWFNLDLSFLYVICTYTIFVLVCLEARKNWFITKTFKNISIFICTMVVLAAFTIMYTQWTKNGEVVIDGVQGRYFLPIILLVPILCLPTKKLEPLSKTIKINSEKHNFYIYGYLVFISFFALSHIISNHI